MSLDRLKSSKIVLTIFLTFQPLRVGNCTYVCLLVFRHSKLHCAPHFINSATSAKPAILKFEYGAYLWRWGQVSNTYIRRLYDHVVDIVTGTTNTTAVAAVLFAVRHTHLGLCTPVASIEMKNGECQIPGNQAIGEL